MNMYETTGDPRYQTMADETMWNISQKGYQVGISQAMRAMSQFEKPYFIGWMKETNPNERAKILESVPEDIGNLLKVNWGVGAELPQPHKYESFFPQQDWEGLVPGDTLENIKIKTIEREGLRAHDFGLGWYDQQRSIAFSPYNLEPVSSVTQVASPDKKLSNLKHAITTAMTKFTKRPRVSISTTMSGNDVVRLQINILRDRYDDFKELLTHGG
jgi:hypothetical protein